VTAAIRGVIEGDRYPHAPRLDRLRAALARFEAAAEPAARPKAPPPAKAKWQNAKPANAAIRVQACSVT
jgi:hypothetical protein